VKIYDYTSHSHKVYSLCEFDNVEWDDCFEKISNNIPASCKRMGFHL